MVYIYRKAVGEKTYYYLRASERKGNKILVKDIAYLGISLEEVKTALNNLPHYAPQIRKAYKTIHHFLESNHYLEKVRGLKLKRDHFLENKLFDVESCKLHYTTVFHHFPELTKQEIFKNFIIEFAFNTNSIEGNTIKLPEARNLLQEGITPKDTSLREIHDMQNTEKVFTFLQQSAEELTHELIITIHAQLMENVDPRIGYRTTYVRVIRSNFDATPAPYVKTDMGLLLGWYDKNRSDLHPIVLAAIFHHKFEKIHPFLDGNGRTGRMIFNYILMKHNYPPTIIHAKNRKDYLKAMRIADSSKPLEATKEQYQQLIEFVAEEMHTAYWSIFL